jgi:hypothetical protein
VVAALAVTGEFPLPEAQRPNDRPGLRVGGGHQLLQQVRLEAHVGVQPQQPRHVGGVEEVLDGLVARRDQLAGVAAHRDDPAAADPLVGAEVGDHQLQQREVPGVGDLVLVAVGNRHRVGLRLSHGIPPVAQRQ